jgi:sensor histidine kinase YesM
VLSAIGSLLRTTLDYGEQQVVPLREELRLAESYLDIERVRLGERLKVTVDVAPETLDAQVPVLLLQPLLENAIRHGISDREGGGSIVVTTREDGDAVVLEVRDDGGGFPDEILSASRAVVAEDGSRRIGLENDRERLRVLYGEAQSFELSNAEGGGAVVRIRVPRAGADAGASGA